MQCCCWSRNAAGIHHHFDLVEVRANPGKTDEVVLAFMGRLSTSIPLRSFAALAAASDEEKMMSAIPRL